MANTGSKQELLAQLRAQVASREARVRPAPLPVPAEFAGVLEGGLKAGSTYCLGGSGALRHTLLVEPTAAGHWAAVVGIPEFGVEAAARAGVVLDRLVLVPQPAEHWLTVVAALAEAVPVIVVRPFGKVRESEAAKLGSRLRDRGAVLLVDGVWPRPEARLELSDGGWSGLGVGHGYLAEREVTLTVTSRRFPAPQQLRLCLPTRAGGLAGAAEPVLLGHSELRAVG